MQQWRQLGYYNIIVNDFLHSTRQYMHEIRDEINGDRGRKLGPKVIK